MDWMSFYATLMAWSLSGYWLAGGMALLCLELLAPGAFFLWIGLSCLVVSFLSWAFPLSVLVQCISLAILAPLMTWGGRKLWHHKADVVVATRLNQRGHNVLGHVLTLNEPIVNGHGYVTIDDTRWRIHGPDMAVGTQVHIQSIQGNVLTVEKV
ncbi:MAG: NfeD family protein [Alphaproteobacteria bacterium]|nr:NfeD family protein [Alphaproteobacteria bacterium]